MEHIGHEELTETLERINGWIENCDSKAATILSGMGVIAGILLATDYISKFRVIFLFMCEKKNIWTFSFIAISVFALCLLTYGSFLLVRVLFARTDKNELKGKGIKTESLIYFSSIAKNQSLSEYQDKLKNCKIEQMQDDLISQIYVCSLICDKKFSLYKKGLLCALAGFSIFVVMAIIGVAAI